MQQKFSDDKFEVILVEFRSSLGSFSHLRRNWDWKTQLPYYRRCLSCLAKELIVNLCVFSRLCNLAYLFNILCKFRKYVNLVTPELNTASVSLFSWLTVNVIPSKFYFYFETNISNTLFFLGKVLLYNYCSIDSKWIANGYFWSRKEEFVWTKLPSVLS